MKLLPLFIILLLLTCTFAVDANNPNEIFDKKKEQGKDIISPKGTNTKIWVEDKASYDTIVESDNVNNKIKISHMVSNNPLTLVYEFNYTGKVLWGDWVNYFSLSNGTPWVSNLTGYSNNRPYADWLMFDDGNVFDWSDFKGTTAHFNNIWIGENHIIITFDVDNSPSYPYLLDPAFGNGTIQTCQTTPYDTCNVSISSTITSQDYYVNITNLRILSGITVGLDRSRLWINTSQSFVMDPGSFINASGTDAATYTGGHGGSGGSVIAIGSIGNLNISGADDGANGTKSNNGGTCLPATGTIGQGSGLIPFEYVGGVAGSVSGGVAHGGGFYSSGSAHARITGATCDSAESGGSGHAIKITSPVINISGTINDDGGLGSSGGGTGTHSVAGSGGGEVILRANNITINGTINVSGSPYLEAGSVFVPNAEGGEGGRIKVCSAFSQNVTGTLLADGGVGSSSAYDGDDGQIDLITSSFCFNSTSEAPITILSPSNGSIFYTPNDVPYLVVADSAGYTSCNVSNNGNLIGTFYPVYSANSGVGLVIGQNNVSVSCLSISGTLVNTSSYFTYNFVNTSTVFQSAFNIDISSCPVATYNELIGQCPEFYKIPRVFNFSAVPCESLNLSLNYSCLSTITNVTKVGPFANWTIFYTPSYWQYHGAIGVANQSFQLTGAEFVYNSKFVMHSADRPNGGGMELIDNSSFMYVPAQNKTTDCGYFYTSIYGTNCSYGYGFIVNDRIVAVADEFNQWYTASGVGVSNSSTISSSPVVYVNVIPLAPAATNPFATGMYTRSICSLSNNTYTMIFTNTISQSFTIFINYNSTNQTSYTINSTTFSSNTPANNVTSIALYDSNNLICTFGNQTNVFIPFNFIGGNFTDGYSNMILKLFLMFTTVLTAISPFALIATFMINDLYHVLSVSDLAVIGALAGIAGLINNNFSAVRGIKNMVIIVALCLAYLQLTLPHITSCSAFNADNVINTLFDISALTTAQGLGNQLIGFGIAIVNLFVRLMTLPATVVYVLNALLSCVVPATLWSPLSLILTFLGYGATIWMWIKGYEVVTNRFLGV